MKKFYGITILLVLVTVVSFGFVVKGLKQDNFWREAAQSGMTEIMLANLAMEKSGNDEIKNFAQKVITDHTTVGDELKTVAASKNVTLPTDISAKQKASMDKLSKMSGTDFDRAFLKQMVTDHEAAVKLFQKQADSGTDADVKAFAAKHLPTLQDHLSMAQTMSSGGMNDMDSNSNSNMMNSNMMMNSNQNMNSRNRNSNRNMNSNGDSNMNMNSNMMNSNMNSNGNTNPNRNRKGNPNSNSNMNSNMNGM